MQSEAVEGAMRPAEGAIAPSAPVWLRTPVECLPMTFKAATQYINLFQMGSDVTAYFIVRSSGAADLGGGAGGAVAPPGKI